MILDDKKYNEAGIDPQQLEEACIDPLQLEEERIDPQQLENEERIDEVDHLIFRELGQEAKWRQTLAVWDQRARQQRRLRILPVLSNVASVAALFVLGLIVEAMVPGVPVSDSIAPLTPILNPQHNTSSTEAPAVVACDTLAADSISL